MSTLTLSEIAARYPGQVFLPTPVNNRKQAHIPLFSQPVRAGFPSPADDYIEDLLDLNEYLVHDVYGTFMVRVQGDSMIDALIGPGDVLIVDRGLPPSDGDIVVAKVDDQFTVKELRREFGQIALMPRNKRLKPIILKEGQELVVFGVVTAVVRKLKSCWR